MKPVKKYSVYKCKLSLSLALLYLAELVIVFFSYRMALNTRGFTTLFDEISPKELNKCLQKFYLSARKRDGRSVIARPQYSTKVVWYTLSALLLQNSKLISGTKNHP